MNNSQPFKLWRASLGYIAAVAADALCEDGHNGAEYVLTGPHSLSQVEQLRIIGQVIGRRLRFEAMPVEDFRREMTRQAPGPWVDMLLGAWRATLGHRALVTSTVAAVTGSRRARSAIGPATT